MGTPEGPFWNENRCHKHGWCLLLALTLILYLPGTISIPLMDRDEPRFAHATVEMIDRGSWAVPYFNGEYRFDKPPLTYWWMRLHYALLGVNELAARLHSVIAVFLTALVTCGMARSLTQNARLGLFAGVAWLTCLQALAHGRLCVADMPMVLFVTLGCRALVELLTDASEKPVKPWGGWFWCLWLSLGAGFLAKGPIAWLVPALALVLWRWLFWRKPLPWRRVQALPGMLVALIMVAAWGIPALIETKGAYWQAGIGEHVVKRGTDVFNGRKFIPGYYLITTWFSLFPWMMFVLPVWRVLRTNWTPQTSFLVAWFMAPQVIFFFYATQLPHYVMPGYPAFFVLLALAWQQRKKGDDASALKMVRWSILAFMLMTAGVWLLAQVTMPDGMRTLACNALAALIAFAGIGSLTACLVWQNGMTRKNKWMICVAVFSAGASLIPLAKILHETSVPVQVAKYLSATSSSTELHGCGYAEPSLVFYTNRKWQFTDDLSSAKDRLGQPGPVAIVLLKREWTLEHWFKGMIGAKPKGEAAKDHSALVDELSHTPPGVQSHVIEGFNTARTSWVEVVLLIKP